MLRQTINRLTSLEQPPRESFFHDRVKKRRNPNSRPSLLWFWLPLLICVMLFGLTPVQAKSVYKVTTGLPSSNFYRIGVAISTLMQLKRSPENNFQLEVKASDGVVENIQALLKGEVDIAFADASTIFAAASKAPPFDKYDNVGDLQALAVLWPDVAHIMLHDQEAQTGEIKDYSHLLGEIVSFGQHNTSSNLASKHVFRRVGINYDQLFRLPDFDVFQSANGFIEGRLNGFSHFTFPGNGVVEQIMSRTEPPARLLNITDDDLRKINHTDFPIWTRYVIPANTYSNQPLDINTVAQLNFLVVRRDFDNDDAYHIVNTLFRNLTFVKVLNDAAKLIDENHLGDEIILSLHPGTQRHLVETQPCRGLFCLFN